MRGRVLGLGLAAAVFTGTAACDESLSTLGGPTPNLEPTFASIASQIFTTTDSAGRPACSNCHNAATAPFTGLNLSSSAAAYATLVNVGSRGRPGVQRVSPGNPENSYLIHKLEGRPGIVGVRMPLNGPYLSDGQIRIIRRWIELGANND
jgi:hypothetical protein